ncbi:MAG TPA: hypothetical protein VJM84_02680 [Actinomycetota bacterium]|nr:hypothetical protein [Actinomycetota bacterium]
MLNADAARYRVNDMVRSSEAHRASRGIAARRSAHRKTVARRVISTAAGLLPIPVKH